MEKSRKTNALKNDIPYLEQNRKRGKVSKIEKQDQKTKIIIKIDYIKIKVRTTKGNSTL